MVNALQTEDVGRQFEGRATGTVIAFGVGLQAFEGPPLGPWVDFAAPTARPDWASFRVAEDPKPEPRRVGRANEWGWTIAGSSSGRGSRLGRLILGCGTKCAQRNAAGQVLKISLRVQAPSGTHFDVAPAAIRSL